MLLCTTLLVGSPLESFMKVTSFAPAHLDGLS